MTEEPEASLEQRKQDDVLDLSASGRWVVEQADHLHRGLNELDLAGVKAARIRLGRLERLDTVGAWLLISARERLGSDGVRLELVDVRDEQATLLAQVERHAEAPKRALEGALPPTGAAADAAAEFRARLTRMAVETRDFVAFVGLVLQCVWRLLRGRQRFEWRATLAQMQEVWLEAVLIVALLSFLVGLVIVYQGTEQLERFNRPMLAIDLLGITVLRDIGMLLAALLVAGRSGSAFAAQIGAMTVRQEVSAMRATGIDPVATLVVPRILALLLTLPMLGFLSDILALIGGGLMAWIWADMAPASFVSHLQSTVSLKTLLLGLVKAPVFAGLIALIGCFQGLRVRGSAAEVGRHTTRAVVQCIFLVILADALFSVVFVIVDL